MHFLTIFSSGFTKVFSNKFSSIYLSISFYSSVSIISYATIRYHFIITLHYIVYAKIFYFQKILHCLPNVVAICWTLFCYLIFSERIDFLLKLLLLFAHPCCYIELGAGRIAPLENYPQRIAPTKLPIGRFPLTELPPIELSPGEFLSMKLSSRRFLLGELPSRELPTHQNAPG